MRDRLGSEDLHTDMSIRIKDLNDLAIDFDGVGNKISLHRPLQHFSNRFRQTVFPFPGGP